MWRGTVFLDMLSLREVIAVAKCRFCGARDGGQDGICRQCVDELSPTCDYCGMPASRVLNGRAVCDGCYERLTRKRKVGVA